MIEVAQLLEDSELKTEAIERAEDLEEELSRVSTSIGIYRTRSFKPRLLSKRRTYI
jgi:hypothetical protein